MSLFKQIFMGDTQVPAKQAGVDGTGSVRVFDEKHNELLRDLIAQAKETNYRLNNLEFPNRCGPYPVGDGSYAKHRISKDSTLIVQDGHAPFQEAVLRGNVFTAVTQTASSVGAALSTTIATLALFNPPGSGVSAVILRQNFVYQTGTNPYVATCIVPNGTNGPPSSGTTITPRNNNGFAPGGAKVQAYVTGTLAATPVIFDFVHAIGSGLLGLANYPSIGGMFVLAPGNTIVMQGTIAATGFCQYMWEEVPIL